MGQAEKILRAARANPQSVPFADLRRLLGAAGFELARVAGSHHVFKRPKTPEIINIQSKGSLAKPYQVRQVLDLIDKYSILVK